MIFEIDFTLMKNLWLFIFFPVFLGCNEEEQKNVTYFGGEIVNPHSNQVVLYKNDEAVDSVTLDKNNRFLFTFSDFDCGLYYFYNQPEYQYVIIEKGDSILLRLNTIDFDESLVFSGKGAEKNNFLIDQFLQHEKEKRYIKDRLIPMKPAAFKNSMDSLYAQKTTAIQNFALQQQTSDYTQKLLTNNAGYRLYQYAEVYPFLHQKYFDTKVVKELPADFYNYRKEIELHDISYSYFNPLLKYIRMFASGEAFAYASQKNCSLTATQITHTFDYHQHKLKVLDSTFKNDRVALNTMLRNAAFTFYLDQERDLDLDKAYYQLFKSYVIGNDTLVAEIHELYNNIQHLKNGQHVENVYFINENGEKVPISEANRKKLTVYYFWSIYQKNHFQNLLKRVQYLQAKYPNVHFVGVNKDLKQHAWKEIISTYRLAPEDQYRIDNYNTIGKKLMLDKMNKVIIIDKENVVVDAFADIYSVKFENILSKQKL